FDTDAMPNATAATRYRSVVCSSLRYADRARSALTDPAAPSVIRRQARLRCMAERPHTMAAARQPAATGRRRGLTIRTEWYESAAPSARLAPDPQLQGRGAEVEVLADAALQVAQVGRRQGPAGEQGEGGRVGRTLGCVAHPHPGRRRMGGLGRLEDLVQLARRHPPVVGVDGL